MNIFEKFNQWYQQELEVGQLKLPGACSFTSIGLDGYPNTRFVSLKEVKDHAFIITGPLNSRKGNEISANPKVSLAFWWTETERQIRIQGDAIPISDDEADHYFAGRNRASKIVSTVFNQGQKIKDYDQLRSMFADQEKKFGSHIERPKEWGGFKVVPIRIEFMQFKSSRLHQRELYAYKNDRWEKHILQP